MWEVGQLSTLDDMTPDERQRIREVLGSEYTLLTNALTAAWSASLVRTSIFVVSLSAAGVALDFVAQRGWTEVRLDPYYS